MYNLITGKINEITRLREKVSNLKETLREVEQKVEQAEKDYETEKAQHKQNMLELSKLEAQQKSRLDDYIDEIADLEKKCVINEKELRKLKCQHQTEAFNYSNVNNEMEELFKNRTQELERYTSKLKEIEEKLKKEQKIAVSITKKNEGQLAIKQKEYEEKFETTFQNLTEKFNLSLEPLKRKEMELLDEVRMIKHEQEATLQELFDYSEKLEPLKERNIWLSGELYRMAYKKHF